MKTVTSTDEFTIYQRRDGRYAVKAANQSAINGEEKVKILLAQGLIKAPAVKQPEPEPEAPAAEEAPEASADEGEAASE